MIFMCPSFHIYRYVLETKDGILRSFFSTVTDKHTVRYNGHEANNLNELEHINGEVWANVWEVLMSAFVQTMS